jgi:zinc finger MIZ domain-containing protein
MNGQQASTAHPGLLIPQIGSRLPHPRVENYQTTALHQSHLMSPILAPIDLSPMASDATLYQLVKSYIIAPHRLDHNNDVIHFLEFELSKDDFARVARTNNPGMPSAARTLRTDSCQYRVRCCTLPSKQGAISELEWVSSDTSFPEFATLKMNDTYLEVRRKQHFAKDRPVDVTDMLKQGSNRLEVYLNVGFNDKKRAGYGVAIECVGSITIEDIKVAVKENCFGETAVLASLRSSLSQPAKGLVVSGTTAGDSDDDIIMVVPETRTIGLRDPISLTALGLLPVRGVNCKHHECFDLDNFLQSRTRTPLPANTFKTLSLPTIRTTSPDVWTCPICKSDVRPCNLGVDLWMLGVREKLQKMGKLNANRIVVQADGSWKVKPDSTTSSTSATTRSNAATQAAATQAAAASNTSPKLRAQLSTGSRITDYALSLDDSDDD